MLYLVGLRAERGRRLLPLAAPGARRARSPMDPIRPCAAAALAVLSAACAGPARTALPADSAAPPADSTLPPPDAPPPPVGSAPPPADALAPPGRPAEARVPGALPPAAPGSAEPSWAPPILHSLAVLTVTRSVEAVLWPEPFADLRLERWAHHYGEAVTKPPLFDASQPAFQWDHDPWPINVIGHGLLGSEIYFRARVCRFSAPAALAFTLAGTHLWEYGYEANGVRPSALDLVYTPLAGVLLGELRLATFRAAEGLESAGARLLVRALVDPLGEIERGIGVSGC
ncbi:DUF3943 domain-containing protein [Sorangium cellulosum]|uniref:DUF3943 domain-containing protein n=1 Tax=Sorangium cellulosum TaxID=56 RepID=UPI0023DDC73A|nr:DUF3943 domain-containing protein [Sorangium cellulosum]